MVVWLQTNHSKSFFVFICRKSPFPAQLQALIYLYLYDFPSPGNLMQIEPQNIQSFVPDFFHWHKVFEVHSCCHMYQQFVLSTAELNFILQIYHILFIQSTVNRFLDCFQFLVIQNNIVMSICIEEFVQTCVLYLIHLGMELSLLLTFKKLSNFFPKKSVPFYIPTKIIQRFNFLSVFCQHLVPLDFLMMTIPVDVQQYVICISLETLGQNDKMNINYIEQLYMCFLTIYLLR